MVMEKSVDELKMEIVEFTRRLYMRGLIVGTGGNVSVRIPDSPYILVTPSGLCKGYLKPSDIVKIDLDGRIVEGRLKPTSETPMHIEIYKARRDVNAIVHAHPPFCTGFSCAGIPLDKPILPEAVIVLGEITVVEYETPGTMSLARKVAEAAKKCDVLVLENHGSVALGENLEQAYVRTEVLEEYAKVLLISNLLGGPKILSEEEVRRLRGFKIYGQSASDPA